jgi:ATP-dependent Clp protease ATP-binding subunit ClpC
LFFFFAMAALLYFFSRATRAAHRWEKTISLGFGETLNYDSALGATWTDAPRYHKIDISRSLSLDAEKAVEDAYLSAQKYNSHVLPEHFFLSLLKSPKVKIIFGRLGVPAASLKARIDRNIAPYQEKEIIFSPAVQEAFFKGYVASATRRSSRLGTSALLLEIVKASDFLQEVLYELNIDATKLQNVTEWINIQDKLYERWQEFRHATLFRKKGGMNRAMTAVQTLTLNSMSEDITAQAAQGAVDFCIGREDIFEHIFRVAQGGGRGVILVGERGVGKSAIIDGLAELMINEDVPKILSDKRLVRLSLAEIVGGGSVEQAGEKIITAIGEAIYAGNIVLEIPNLEYLAGERGARLITLLAEELRKSALPVFAATTPEGYAQAVENTALSSIFERIDVSEPDENLAIQILEAESSSVEYRNGVYFSYDALAGAVKLSGRYLHEKFLPDKAIEIIKEAALQIRKTRGAHAVIGYEDIAAIISEKSKIPVSALTESEKDKLLKMEAIIRGRIIGQTEAVEAVSAALRRARSGLGEGKRPIANFLFLGPTGVGKTELAKTIAEVYFGSENAMIRLDMSEYQEQTSIYRMIGESGAEGFLTEAVRHKPFALVLLDELEKAHKDILNLFLQVMEDGRLTDGRGKTIDFTNVILVATSNAGSGFIAESISAGMPLAEIKEKLLTEKLSANFRPEFLNRFDGVIVFTPLTSTDIEKVTGLLLAKIAKTLELKGIELVVEEAAVQALAKAGFDPKFGARPLRRVIAKEIEDSLANLILQGKVKRRDMVVVHNLGDIEVVSAKSF